MMYKSLQSGRAIAATLVLLFHLGAAIAADKYFGIKSFFVPFSFGDSGVEFFFVLSGFIIFYIHRTDLGTPRSLPTYLYKRITRIYPTYLIIFIGVYCLALSSAQLRNTVPHDFIVLVKSILLIPQNKELVGGTGAPVIIVAWTLQYEMLFYISFALGIINKRAGAILVVGYLLGCAFQLNDYGFPLNFLFSHHVLLFLFGILVAWLVTLRSITKVNPLIFALCGLSLYLFSALDKIALHELSTTHQSMLYGIGCSFGVLAMISYEKDGKVFLEQRFFQLLGSASYALYLIHFPLISILCKVLTHIGLNKLGIFGALVAFIIMFVTCIVASIGFHLAIEKPIARKLRQFVPSPRV